VYLLPLFPALSLLTASALADALRGEVGRRPRAALLAATVVLALGAATLAAGGAGSVATALAPWLEGSDRRRLPAALGILEQERWRVALALLLGAACLATLAARGIGAKGRAAALVAGALVWSVGLAALGTYPLALQVTPRTAVARVRSLVPPDASLCAAGFLGHGFTFYLGRRLPPCRARPAEAPPGRVFSVAREADDDSGLPRYRVTARGERGREEPAGSPAGMP
jgi:hypothetical protein